MFCMAFERSFIQTYAIGPIRLLTCINPLGYPNCNEGRQLVQYMQGDSFAPIAEFSTPLRHARQLLC